MQTLRRQLGLGQTHRHGQSREALGRDEWWGRELAERLGVSRNSLFYWIEHGEIRSTFRRSSGWANWLRKERGGLQRWMVWADAAEHRRRWMAAYHGNDHQKGPTA
ncbi:MAG: hypothetical protein ACLQUY_17540 [Ktedonobacterales bacterium]